MDPAVTIALVGLVVSAAALGVAIKASRQADDALTESRRMADAAEAANELAAPGRGFGEVRWEVEHSSGGEYLLRNVGTASAQSVTIRPEEVAGMARHLPTGETVEPGDAVPFYLGAAMGSPLATSVPVRWDGHDVAVRVPVPLA